MKKRLPIYTTPEGRAKYMAAYEAMFSLWTVPNDAVDVKTGYGSTHINVSGPSDGHSLVLLHGAGLSSTAWFANIAALSANYRVYAVDIIGDAGKSVADRVIEKRTDYAAWLKEVFDGLNIERAYLLGHSYGGWLTLNMALAHPDRLKAIVLLAPAASIYPMSLLANLGLRLPFKIRPPARFVFKMIASKGTVFEATFIHLMEMVTKYCLPALMFPTVYTDEELRQIEMPALLLIGAGEKIYNPKKAIDRAQRWMPALTAKIIPNVDHTLNMEQPQTINALILEFLSGDEC
ncbi:MAG: alpha/beta hydrolase [Planctomycetes bacterium]|nr:alpha/beta hydrolase [Planctomycetota bacterium]